MDDTTTAPALLWFRNDLRLDDNLALAAAVESGRPILAVHVEDSGTDGRRAPGGASRWWLHHSLASLNRSLAELGIPLVLRRGPEADVLRDLVGETGAGAVFWNRRYDAPGIAADSDLKASLRASDIACESFNGALLIEPWRVRSGSGGPLKVFTPFWRAAQAAGAPPQPLDAPAKAKGHPVPPPSDRLEDWGLLPTRPDWAGGLRDTWQPGEASARRTLSRFIDERLAGYADNRDQPGCNGTSILSPHLRFGEISPRRIWHEVCAAGIEGAALTKFQAELGWREFSYHLLFHFPDLATRNFQRRFDAFPWREDPAGLTAWQRGRTGYPLVDAGMRQLWQTGTMHNRVRMVAASFLVKHLLLDWRLGEAWFWDTLVDADPASNTASWQWVAGSGADAAPYFRIFNPTTQGERFDGDGAYTRQWLPELARLPDRYLFRPHEAPSEVLAEAGVRLGDTYPFPIVEHAKARQRALDAFETLKSAA
ncbi:cryptochrome/photolyase family protein [Stappia indica]|uniref:cryptochrome/photolyase family protein n=1 Tax=Stappia indica TaxID=538381 RepID=UPI001CD1CBD9|nr:deoxyribodipyrimidine photo-lyase [Stappia indica]MCA1297450.1 DNA photolyase family protein [Stappia indica]